MPIQKFNPVLTGLILVLTLIILSPAAATKLTNGQSCNYFEYSTLLGGSERDFMKKITPTNDGGIFAVMYSNSTGFFTTKTTQSDLDTYILKFDATGTVSRIIGPLGGSGDDMGETLAIDTNGDLLLIGYTASLDLPVTTNALNTTYQGGYFDGFLMRLSPDGSQIKYCSYLGGQNVDYLSQIKLDAAGNIWLTGHTNSSNYPVTANALDTSYNGDLDVTLTELTNACDSILYSTYIGGSDRDYNVQNINIDSAGNLFLTGATRSANFPVTTNAYDTSLSGTYSDAFVLKFNPSTYQLVFSTFLGGALDDYSMGSDLLPDGRLAITGYSQSTNFPITANAMDTVGDIWADAFFTIMKSDGSGLDYSTFIGKLGGEYGVVLSCDTQGIITIGGQTGSIRDLPFSPGAMDTTNAGGWELFVMRWDSRTNTMIHFTLLGGSNDDYFTGIVPETNGSVWFSGWSNSTIGFPCTVNSIQSTFSGGYNDAFIMKMTPGWYLDSKFSVNKTRGIAPLSVDFIDETYGAPDYWAWDFGDGQTSSLQNPTHTYSTAGQYTLRLVTTNPLGSDTCELTNYIHLYSSSTIDFPEIKYTPGTAKPKAFIVSDHDPEGQGTYEITSNFLGLATLSNSTVSLGPWSEPTTGYLYIKMTHPLITLTARVKITITRVGFTSLDFPAIKLLPGESLPNAYALADYDTLSTGTYQLVENFLNLGTLSNGTISISSWGQPTSGFIYINLTHSGQTTIGRIPIKISTYRIAKLPHFGFQHETPMYLNMATYVTNSAGPAIPPSFGNNSCLVYDTQHLDVHWVDSTTLYFKNAGGYSLNSSWPVHIIASPNSAPPYGSDMDIEVVDVRTNYLAIGQYLDNSNWLYGIWGKEMITDYSDVPAWEYISNYVDSVGNIAKGVWSFSFTSTNQAYKLTSPPNNWRTYDKNQWGIARMRVMSPTPNNDLQVGLFNFNGVIPTNPHLDISCNILFGVPTVWTWIEAPLYTQDTGPGYVQIILKPGTKPGVVYIDQLDIVDVEPFVIDSRTHSELKYPYRSFSNLEDLAYGWSTTEGDCPLNVVNNSVQFDFSKATTGIQYGKKLTAQLNHSGVYTPSSLPNHDVGLKANVQIDSGNFNTYSSIILMALYGVPSNGSYDFWSTGGQLFASAEFGKINNGYHYVIGPGRNSYHQFQFIANSDVVGKINVSDIDFLRDLDDPYFGDLSLW